MWTAITFLILALVALLACCVAVEYKRDAVFWKAQSEKNENRVIELRKARGFNGLIFDDKKGGEL